MAMGNFTQKRWMVSSKDTGENGKVGRTRSGQSVTTRNPGRNLSLKSSRTSIQQRALQPNDTHYLDMSFDFYPCNCKFNKQLTVKLALRCHDCLMSTQSRISQMKTKI